MLNLFVEFWKKTAAIPLLDSLIIQMQDRFSDEDRHARRLLCLVPSIIANKVLNLKAEVTGMLYWEKEVNGLPHSFCRFSFHLVPRYSLRLYITVTEIL